MCDALSVTEEEYAKVAAEFLQDIGSKDIKAVSLNKDLKHFVYPIRNLCLRSCR